jgi:hypothetical protein
VPRLVVAHLVDDRAASRIGRRQAVDVRRQMLLDLPLGLDDEAEVRRVAREPGGEPDAERARVPEWIQQRRARGKIGEALLRPCEMIFFLARGFGEARADLRIARDQRLRRVERLRADLPGVIDAHESGGVTPVGGLLHRFGEIRAGRRTRRRRRAGERSQGAVEAEDEGVDHGGWDRG